jgi:hypothetical protein
MLETRRCMVSARSRGDSRRKLARSSAFLLSMMDNIRILYHTSRLYHQIQPLPLLRVGTHGQARGVNG